MNLLMGKVDVTLPVYNTVSTTYAGRQGAV